MKPLNQSKYQKPDGTIDPIVTIYKSEAYPSRLHARWAVYLDVLSKGHVKRLAPPHTFEALGITWSVKRSRLSREDMDYYANKAEQSRLPGEVIVMAFGYPKNYPPSQTYTSCTIDDNGSRWSLGKIDALADIGINDTLAISLAWTAPFQTQDLTESGQLNQREEDQHGFRL